MSFVDLMRKNRLLLTIAICFSLLATATTLLQPKLVGELMAGIQQDSFREPLLKLLLLLVLTAILTGATTYTTAVAADRAVKYLRKKIIRHIIGLQVSEFEKVGSGGYTTRVTSDTSLVSTAFSSALVNAIGGLTIVIGATIYMAIVDLRLLLVVLLVVTVSMVIISFSSSSIGRLSQSVQDNLSYLGSILQPALSSIRTVKSFRAEPLIIDRLDQKIEKAYTDRRRMSAVEAILSPISTLTAYLALGAVIVYGSFRVSNGDLSAQSLVVFVTALFVILAPLSQIAESFADFFEARGAMVRINEILDTETEAVTRVENKAIAHTQNCAIKFQNVSFSREDTAVLRDVNIAIAPGEKVALTGPSGSGKTTLFSLLLGFYSVNQGEIVVGEHSLEDWRLSELRQTIAYVEQEPDLLPGTLRENLTLGDPGACDDAYLKDLLTKFGLGEFATQEGLNKEVTYGMTGFSGGEKQRIALIRALVLRTPIILVDEPTSALDSETAAMAISQLLETESTVIFISHSPELVAKADRMLGVQDGTISEIAIEVE